MAVKPGEKPFKNIDQMTQKIISTSEKASSKRGQLSETEKKEDASFKKKIGKVLKKDNEKVRRTVYITKNIYDRFVRVCDKELARRIMNDEEKITLNEWINIAVDWLTINLAPFFDVVTSGIRLPLVGLEQFLWWLQWWVVILIFTSAAWKIAGWKISLFATLGLLFIGVIGHWDATMTTLAIIVISVLVSLIIGIPLGILAGRNRRAESFLRPILDFMQTMPPYVYLLPGVAFLGFGESTAISTTTIFAIPPALKLTNLGIRQVPVAQLEAGRSFGESPAQLLFKVQIPCAMPSIMAGVNQTLMLALAMSVIAGIVGGGGLGAMVYKTIMFMQIGKAFNAGLAIVIIAIVIDRLSEGMVSVFHRKRREL